MGMRISYRDGARSKMPTMPERQAAVKSHRNNRSRTIATYFQSSTTYFRNGRKRGENILKTCLLRLHTFILFVLVVGCLFTIILYLGPVKAVQHNVQNKQYCMWILCTCVWSYYGLWWRSVSVSWLLHHHARMTKYYKKVFSTWIDHGQPWHG